MPSSPLSLSMPLTDIRLLAGATLPAKADDDDVAGWTARQVHRLGGSVRQHLDGSRVVVEWTPDTRRQSGPAEAVEWLKAGQYHEASVVLELLLSAQPDNEVVLYNLGMVHSDLGNFGRAEELLRKCLVVEPKHINARVALGVALLRQGQTAEGAQMLQDALAVDPDNSWAHRNLAVALQRQGNIDSAVEHLRSTVALNPRDELGWTGLGKALEQAGEMAEADEAFKRVIELAGFGDAAEMAQQGRSRIAQSTFHANAAGAERPDAVMYCLAALESFGAMGEAELKAVVLEIATLGQQGLDVNNPDRTHRLRALPGEFTGLQLVSYLYVGMQRIAPGQDVGFDLVREYNIARALYRPAPMPSTPAVE